MNIEEIKIKASSIHGAFLLTEIETMAKLASEFKQANFVEIGSNLGRSSSVLGMIARENDCNLTCIDSFIELNDLHSSGEVEKVFKDNMESVNAKYELLSMTSQEASKLYNKSIDLLFIDGDHAYAGVKLDIQLWMPKVKPGGYILFHDYVGGDGVRQAVDETINLERVGLYETLLINKKM